MSCEEKVPEPNQCKVLVEEACWGTLSEVFPCLFYMS